ncbi:MAG: hypothetical protein U0166_11055 [Acidobacteriota bacterium]
MSTAEHRGQRATYRAPLRIDLAGGTLDIWPVYLQLRDPVTVNVAIARYAEATLVAGGPAPARGSLASRLFAAIPGRPVGIETRVDCPRGSGLGGSSALCVAIARALFDERNGRATPQDVFRLVRDVESQHIRTPTGDQDYLAAIHGGCSAIRFGAGGATVTRIRSAEAELGRRLVLFYTGVPHFSGINNWAVFRAVFDGDRGVRSRLQSIASVARDVASALEAGDLDRAGVLVGQGGATGAVSPGEHHDAGARAGVRPREAPRRDRRQGVRGGRRRGRVPLRARGRGAGTGAAPVGGGLHAPSRIRRAPRRQALQEPVVKVAVGAIGAARRCDGAGPALASRRT